MMRLRYRIATFALSSLCWSSRTCLLVRSFPLDLFNIVLDANSHADFDNDDYAFKFAVKWQTLRISSTTAAPFVGCADYAEGRHARIRLQRMFGVDAVRTVHHSREHGSSCFVFHAIHEEARALLGEGGGMAGGRGQLQHVIAFPANLKVIITKNPGTYRTYQNDGVRNNGVLYPGTDSGGVISIAVSSY